MSLHNYQESQTLRTHYFETLIMAAIFRADTDNLALLEAAWPHIVAEVRERYTSPGALLASERHAYAPGKPKIFIVAERQGRGNYIGYALAEDGTGLGSHLSSSLTWTQHDMGVISDWKHENYRAHYPDGYELVWIGEWPREGTHPQFDAAYARNLAKGPDNELPA